MAAPQLVIIAQMVDVTANGLPRDRKFFRQQFYRNNFHLSRQIHDLIASMYFLLRHSRIFQICSIEHTFCSNNVNTKILGGKLAVITLILQKICSFKNSLLKGFLGAAFVYKAYDRDGVC